MGDFCEDCGKRVTPGKSFCGDCGAPVQAADSTEGTPAEHPAPSVTVQEAVDSGPPPDGVAYTSKHRIWTVAGGAVVVVAVMLLAWMFLGRDAGWESVALPQGPVLSVPSGAGWDVHEVDSYADPPAWRYWISDEDWDDDRLQHGVLVTYYQLPDADDEVIERFAANGMEFQSEKGYRISDGGMGSHRLGDAYRWEGASDAGRAACIVIRVADQGLYYASVGVPDGLADSDWNDAQAIIDRLDFDANVDDE